LGVRVRVSPDFPQKLEVGFGVVIGKIWGGRCTIWELSKANGVLYGMKDGESGEGRSNYKTTMIGRVN
jgi:hypothetical protein